MEISASGFQECIDSIQQMNNFMRNLASAQMNSDNMMININMVSKVLGVGEKIDIRV